MFLFVFLGVQLCLCVSMREEQDMRAKSDVKLLSFFLPVDHVPNILYPYPDQHSVTKDYKRGKDLNQ